MPDEPELTERAIQKGVDLLADGITNLADWAAKMVCEFGDDIKPRLDNVWEQARVRRFVEDDENLNSLGVMLGFYIEGSARQAVNYNMLFLDDLRAKFGAPLAEWAESHLDQIAEVVKSVEPAMAPLVETMECLVAQVNEIDAAAAADQQS